MGELRDSIRTNWTNTGQELGRELRTFWQNSRPSSPARSGRASFDGRRSGPTSPTAVSHLSHLDIPKSSATGASNGGSSSSADFAAGYSLGLIGGVRSWVSLNHISSCYYHEENSKADG
jgi:choline-phosphate cytidylyltransferase